MESICDILKFVICFHLGHIGIISDHHYNNYFHTKQDAERAKASMNGRLAFGRPLVVRFVDEKVVTHNNDVPSRSSDGWSSGTNKSSNSSAPSALSSSKSAKIAAIQNKLKLMEKEEFQDNESGPRKIAKTSATSRLHSSRSV